MKDRRKEMLYLMMHSIHFIILFTVIWHQTYGKGPLRQRKRDNSDSRVESVIPVTSMFS